MKQFKTKKTLVPSEIRFTIPRSSKEESLANLIDSWLTNFQKKTNFVSYWLSQMMMRARQWIGLSLMMMQTTSWEASKNKRPLMI